MRRALVSSWLFAVVVGACYDLERLDRDTDAREGGPDGGSADDVAPTPTDTKNDPPPDDAGIDTWDILEDAEVDETSIDGSLPRNGGFEEGTIGCGPGWSVHETTPERDPAARTGSWACRVCANSTATYFYILSSRDLSGDGGTWTARAYFRSATDGGPFNARIGLHHTVDADKAVQNYVPVTTAAWSPDLISLTVPGGAGKLYLTVGGDTPLGTCLLVDDVELVYAP